MNICNFKIQFDKYQFLKKETTFLGHVITAQGIQPSADKIKAVKNVSIPTTVKQIKSFLGLTGFYR